MNRKWGQRSGWVGKTDVENSLILREKSGTWKEMLGIKDET